MTEKSRKIGSDVRIAVLTEAGYRCAVPTCRTILTLNLHHIVHVEERGGNDPSNLIALCANCHGLYHQGEIKRESIRVWKGMLVSLGQAFDKEAIDSLLFLDTFSGEESPIISGDTVMKYSRLIASGLVAYKQRYQREMKMGFREMLSEGTLLGYTLSLTQKGKMLVAAWKKGDQGELGRILADAQLRPNEQNGN